MIKNTLNLKLNTQQAMVLTLAMQQALHILQLPVVELAQWLRCEIEQNPALQFDEASFEPSELDFETQGFEVLDHLDESFIQAIFPEEPSNAPENQTPASLTLHDYLMNQVYSTFQLPEERAHAEQIIGSLDEKGFLGNFVADPQILRTIQTFDPPGIAARNLQECLLIQLKLLGKEHTLAYRLIETHFDDILRYRLAQIAKKLQINISDIRATLKKEISSLDFHPGSKFQPTISAAVIPDIFIEQIDQEWHVKINDAPLPQFTLSCDPSLSNYYTQGKWIETILARRAETLQKITGYLLQKHTGFFNGTTSNLDPCSMQELTHHLNLHESTITRAVKEKYISCPHGIFPLRHFFPHTSTTTENGQDISHLDAKQLLLHLVSHEDKNRPLSDHALARAMAQAGIPCARRTVAKYRHSLHIPPANHRKSNSI